MISIYNIANDEPLHWVVCTGKNPNSYNSEDENSGGESDGYSFSGDDEDRDTFNENKKINITENDDGDSINSEIYDTITHWKPTSGQCFSNDSADLDEFPFNEVTIKSIHVCIYCTSTITSSILHTKYISLLSYIQISSDFISILWYKIIVIFID